MQLRIKLSKGTVRAQKKIDLIQYYNTQPNFQIIFDWILWESLLFSSFTSRLSYRTIFQGSECQFDQKTITDLRIYFFPPLDNCLSLYKEQYTRLKIELTSSHIVHFLNQYFNLWINKQTINTMNMYF